MEANTARARKILFATDFSASSRNALKMIPIIREHYKAEILFIHVIGSFWKEWWSSGVYREEALQRVIIWQEELTGEHDLDKLFVEQGNPADRIVYQANESKVDLILLGGHSDHSSGRYKTGYTVESVVRHAQQPVLVCKNLTVNNILCGIDGSEHSKKSLSMAIELANNYQAKLSIVYVLPLLKINPLGIEDSDILKEETAFHEQEKQHIDQFLDGFDYSGIDVKRHYPKGMPPNILLDMAEDFGYDLIVIGAKGHSKLQHLFLGSTAEKVVRHAPCSMLIVR